MSGPVVLDASAAVRIALKGPGAIRAARVTQSSTKVVVPSLLGVEVANALWKYIRAGDLSIERAQDALSVAQRLADVTVHDGELLTEALDEAARRNHPVYDMLYAVLARRQAATLVSFDERLRKVSKRMGVRVLAKR